MPFGGIKMAEEACRNYGYEPDPELHRIFTEYAPTHNEGVFMAYTPEMKKARHNKIITGLPDTYGRGRIVGDYRRVALYGIDFLLSLIHILLKAMCHTYDDLRIDKHHMMVISPDEGALNRNIYYSSAMGVDMGMFYKRRDYTRVVNGRNPIIAHEYLGDSVEGKDVFVADDIIASGDSILDLAYNLKRRKAKRVFAGATFAFFTSGLEAFDKAYAEGMIDHVFATNLTLSLIHI